jgi:DNA-binding NarL/FixJ family response regulator
VWRILCREIAIEGDCGVEDYMKLTEQENRILDLLCENGCTNQEIADQLKVSVETVKHHMSHICDKTGYGTRLELAVNTLHKMYAQSVYHGA